MFSSNTSSAAVPNYIEDVFSTWLYTGTGATQTITNGIDLAGKGGLVWVKSRVNAGQSHWVGDTARGVNRRLATNSTAADVADHTRFNAFNSNGFETGVNLSTASETFVSWTFRKQPKFFDVVTYTGDGSSSRAIPHSLGSAPGCIIVKATNVSGTWETYHRGLNGGTTPENYKIALNSTAAEVGVTGAWANTAPTSTVFYVNGTANTNDTGKDYVAYIFAHNAGGFGLTGTDNVISCGSWTISGSVGSVNLGYEPQWVLAKRADDTGNWFIFDTMRGFTANQPNGNTWLAANTANAENTGASFPGAINATGWSSTAASGIVDGTYIYIAIRRGPMKVPTTGTSVFIPATSTSIATGTSTVTTNFPVDLNLCAQTTKLAGNQNFDSAIAFSRLTGSGANLKTALTNGEGNTSNGVLFDSNTTCNIQYWGYNQNQSGWPQISWNFQRAPGYFDEVCFPTAGSRETNLRVTHNLAVVPELIIVKDRTAAANWTVYSGSINQLIILNSTTAIQTVTNAWGTSAPTSSNFGLDTINFVNSYGDNMVAYLFATCPGVSKVGSYTGTGTTLQINCGFTGGARFVLIKRTDSTGDWYVWDSARGIVAGNDPYLLINSTAAEVTSTDYVDTFSSGFEISSTAPAAINASGGTFIFLAIA
jgi:hypothetical protein